MRVRRAIGGLSAALTMAVVLCACGGVASSASSDSLSDAPSPTADISAAAANPVTVSPQPGTEDASPATQISFLGMGGNTGLQVANVHVVGSRSGVHGGLLRAYSTGAGESFLPSTPFLVGERVTVHAKVGTGTPNQVVSSTFTIAHQASFSQRPFPKNPGDPHAVQHYSSAPGLTPSTVRITTPSKPGAAPGDLFLAPYQGDGSPGPMITEQNGNLVWFHPLAAGDSATNFQVQSYEGKPVLTWWQGKILGVGFGQGEDLIYNSSYQKIAQVKAGNGYHADLHEVRITPQGTAWIDIFDPIHANLTPVKGSADGVVTDSVIQEIDIKTGLVMWEWHALGHIAISDSLNPLPNNGRPWDYAHLNSVDPGSAGDVMVSVRNTWTLYDIDIHSGGFIWRLGGRHSSFKQGPGTRFYWQHDAEFQPGGLISVFDNGSDPPREKQSRGLLLRPDTAGHTVSLVKQLVNPTKTLLAESQGNTLSLPGGTWLLGYGRLPNFTEFDASGHVLLDGTLGSNVQNFKTYLSPWSAHPASTPSLAVQSAAAGMLTVAASWNGATEVASWQVLAGAAPGSLVPVASAPKNGFQTTIAVKPTPAYLAVQALNTSGAVIGLSPTIKA